jgi:uncharacterized protein (TIGR00269 family)
MRKRKCRICGEKADIYLKEHRLALCKKHYIQWFEKRVKETIKEFRMFKKEEKILVAVSGGKDSQVLWYVLNKLGYQAEGFFIDLGIENFSEISKEKVLALGKILNKEPYIISLKEDLGKTLPEIKNMGNICSICGRIKRSYFNKVARLKGFKVVATGHNLDDESSSLLANLINWNLKYLARKYPVLKEEKGFPRKVKPLVKFPEYQIKTYADWNNIPYIQERCPLGETAKLHFYKNLMNQIEENSPGTKQRFYFEYLKKIFPIFQSFKEDFLKGEITQCKICGEPSPSEICFLCKLKGEGTPTA